MDVVWPDMVVVWKNDKWIKKKITCIMFAGEREGLGTRLANTVAIYQYTL